MEAPKRNEPCHRNLPPQGSTVVRCSQLWRCFGSVRIASAHVGAGADLGIRRNAALMERWRDEAGDPEFRCRA